MEKKSQYFLIEVGVVKKKKKKPQITLSGQIFMQGACSKTGYILSYFRFFFFNFQKVDLSQQGLGCPHCPCSCAVGCSDSCFTPAERMRVPPGPFHGGCDARGVLCHGPAVVCGCDRPVHHPRE